jgi:hypothetical protein
MIFLGRKVMKKLIILLIFLLLTGCIPKPEIHIEGVKEGKVYLKDRIIQVDEEAAGTYSLKLNGNDIQNNHKVTGNGEYELKVTTKKWWTEKKETIRFEIDDKPPKKPSFKDEVKEVYLKQAKFILEREDDVTYTITLDGKPTNLEQPVTEAGNHTIEIKAEKDNGLVQYKKVKFEIDNRTYSREAVDTFKRLLFQDGEQQETRIFKWAKTVSVFIYGTPTAEDKQALKSNFNELNKLLPIDFLVREDDWTANSNYSLKIYFVPTHKFKDYGYSGELVNGNKKIVGYTIPTKASEEGILKSNIVVGTNTEQRLRKTTIFHEIIHSLGLYGHLEDNENSILYPYNNNYVTELSEIDKKMIEILYRTEINTGMNESDIERVLKPRIIE